eukprot:997262-Rhodomonas_salina.1
MCIRDRREREQKRHSSVQSYLRTENSDRERERRARGRGRDDGLSEVWTRIQAGMVGSATVTTTFVAL